MESGTIYIVEHKSRNGIYKIGQTRNWENRKNAYGVDAHNLDSWTIESKNVSLSEKLLHMYFSNKRTPITNKYSGTIEVEWFALDKNDIKNILTSENIPLYVQMSFNEDLPHRRGYPSYEDAEIIKTNNEFRKSVVGECLKKKEITTFEAFAVAFEKKVKKIKNIDAISRLGRKGMFEVKQSIAKRDGNLIDKQSFLMFIGEGIETEPNNDNIDYWKRRYYSAMAQKDNLEAQLKELKTHLGNLSASI